MYAEKKVAPPFLLTIRMLGKNIHNCMMDSGALANVMPLGICKTLGLTPTKSAKVITQLDKIEVNVIGKLMHIQMQLTSDPRVSQFIDIQVVDIPVNYGMLI